MRKLINTLLFVVLMLALAAPALAQDEVISPSFGYTSTDLVLIVIGVLVLGILTVFGVALVTAIRRLSDSLPGWVTGPILSGMIDLSPVLEQLRELVQNTPNPVDDALLTEIERIVQEGLEKIRNQPQDTES